MSRVHGVMEMQIVLVMSHEVVGTRVVEDAAVKAMAVVAENVML
jgi:hypothetical protein